MKTCGLIIPVYNEESVIADTIHRLKEISRAISDTQFEIVCINDGSSDRTAEILREQSGVTVLTHEINRGYGAALRTGLDYCSKEWIFIVDADGTYPLEDLGRLLAEANRGPDMVVGARRGAGISRSPHKRVARWILRKLVHALTGVMVPDLNSGMRVFRKSLYSEFRHLLPMGFSFTSTITVASLYSGYRIKYIPIEYAERVGKSNIKPFQDFLGFTMLIIRLASYFEPLRFFIPASLILFFFSVIWGIRDLILTNHIGSLSAVMAIGAIQVFITGILADVIVRRSNNPAPPKSS